ncbi:MAG: carboxypeptidase-like regulatory domain-containing protein [Candidatus Kapaibacterium sp.]
MKSQHSKVAYRIGLIAFLASLTFAASLAMLAGCRKVNSPTTPPEGANITTTIAGRVTDESGAAIAGVTITGQSGSATTDANGLFFIQNTSVPSERTFILAKKAGYFDGARAAIPTANGVTICRSRSPAARPSAPSMPQAAGH